MERRSAAGPDRTFHSFGASKSEDRRNLYSSETTPADVET